LYRDSSIGNDINVVVTRLVILTDDQVRDHVTTKCQKQTIIATDETGSCKEKQNNMLQSAMMAGFYDDEDGRC
jgi:hypothetical protein